MSQSFANCILVSVFKYVNILQFKIFLAVDICYILLIRIKMSYFIFDNSFEGLVEGEWLFGRATSE